MTVKEFSAYTSFSRFSVCLVLAGGIALFVVCVSWDLFLNPLSPKVQGNFFSIDASRKSVSKLFALNVNEAVEPLPSQNCLHFQDPSGENNTSDAIRGANQSDSLNASNDHNMVPLNSSELIEEINQSFSGISDDCRNVNSVAHEDNQESSNSTMKKVGQDPRKFSSDAICEVDHANRSVPLSLSKPLEKLNQSFEGFFNGSSNFHSEMKDDNIAQSGVKDDDSVPEASNSSEFCSKPRDKISQGFSNDSRNVSSRAQDDNVTPSNSTMTITDQVDPGSCNLYQGKWFYDPSGPLYTNNKCPVLTKAQNCQGNGRPDKEYEYWRWKPAKCELPRFNATKFLELMKGKTLAFIGDSIARNQMESLLCILWQVEAPENHGQRRFHHFIFNSASVHIIRIWSSWLVKKTSERFQFAPEGVIKLHLDIPDANFMELLPTFDVVVISGGHWFNKQSAYILKNEIVGGQFWWPDKTRKMKVDKVKAFAISTETTLSAIASHPNYTGLTIVRSFSPNHYEGGAWNSGGSCTGMVKPALESELVENEYINIMHQKQLTAFNNAIKKATNKSKFRLMDITKIFGYRHDGHPGPYKSPNPNNVTMLGQHGELHTQDCLHWCMPGAVDTWNELALEIIRREFEGAP